MVCNSSEVNDYCLFLIHSKKSTDGLKAQVFESDIIDEEKVFINT